MTAPHPIVPGVEFRELADFPGYLVGDDGSVWSTRARTNGGGGLIAWADTGVWRRMKPNVVARGYLRIGLRRGGKKYSRPVHALVLEAFVGPRPPKMHACHGNGDPQDNRLANLRWDTVAGNEEDKRSHGTLARGERVGTSKLKEEDIVRIHSMRRAGMPYEEIGREVGVSKSQIFRICKGQAWSHDPAQSPMPSEGDPMSPSHAQPLMPAGSVVAEARISGRPVPWCSPAMSRLGYEIPTRARKRLKQWQEAVHILSIPARRIPRPYAGPVDLEATFFVARGGSHGDRDNIQKALTDAIQGVVILNDRQVRGGECRLVLIDDGDERVEYRVTACGPDGG